MNTHYIFWGVGIACVIIIAGLFLAYQQAFAPTESSLPERSIPDAEDADSTADTIEIVATDLNIPWEMVWLPDGTTLITERPGQLVQLGTDGEVRRVDVPRVSVLGEGGLLGMTLHPEYEDNNWLYLYRTYREDTVLNEVVRYTYDQATHTLHEELTIIDAIPGARYHDGGRIAFGPDGYLYITTGDAVEPRLSQDRDSLAGKILRVTEEGAVPEDNPFGTPVYSYGHRNPQGIAWDDAGRLWSTEHGQRAQDELNRIEAGGNYGWPEIEGDETAEGMKTAVVNSGTNETWAPSGMSIVGDTIFFTGLRGARLYRADIIDENRVELSTYFAEEYGRLRTAVLNPTEDALYLLTNNTDGRGSPEENDDRVIRVPLSLLFIGE